MVVLYDSTVSVLLEGNETSCNALQGFSRARQHACTTSIDKSFLVVTTVDSNQPAKRRVQFSLYDASDGEGLPRKVTNEFVLAYQ